MDFFLPSSLSFTRDANWRKHGKADQDLSVHEPESADQFQQPDLNSFETKMISKITLRPVDVSLILIFIVAFIQNFHKRISALVNHLIQNTIVKKIQSIKFYCNIFDFAIADWAALSLLPNFDGAFVAAAQMKAVVVNEDSVLGVHHAEPAET